MSSERGLPLTLAPLLLRFQVITHQSIAFLRFFVSTLNHTPHDQLGLVIEFIHLSPKEAVVLCMVYFLRFGVNRFLLDELESVWMCE